MTVQNKTKLIKGIVVGIVPLTAVIVGYLNVPHPTSAAKERSNFKRAKVKSALLEEAPKPNTAAVGIELGAKIRYLGANLPKKAVKPGDEVPLEFFFEVMDSLDRSWRMFLHIDPTSQGRRIHGDHHPVKSKYPTNLWQKGEKLVDRHLQRIPTNAAPGRYTIWMGFYIGDERLPITKGEKPNHDGGNRIRVGTLTITQP